MGRHCTLPSPLTTDLGLDYSCVCFTDEDMGSERLGNLHKATQLRVSRTRSQPGLPNTEAQEHLKGGPVYSVLGFPWGCCLRVPPALLSE